MSMRNKNAGPQKSQNSKMYMWNKNAGQQRGQKSKNVNVEQKRWPTK